MERQRLRILRELFDNDVVVAQPCSFLDAETLASYVEAELAGRNAEATYPTVNIHLQSCTACREEYTAFKSLLQLEDQQALQPPPIAATFDFSYLARTTEGMPAVEAAEVAKRAWHWDELDRLVIQFSAALLQTLQPKLQPMVYAPERSPLDTNLLYQFALQQAVADLNVTIDVKAISPASDFCRVVVEVEIPSRGGWPNLAGTQVVLKRGGAVVQTQETDPFGKTAFRDVLIEELPLLAFEITPVEMTAG